MATFTLTQSRESADLYLYPDANGCNIDLTPIGAARNWDCVNDSRNTPDDDDTYVYSSSTILQYDLYGLPNHTTESGTINYVQVFNRAKSNNLAQHNDGIYKIILTDNACADIYKSNDINLTTSYQTQNQVWETNPRTTATWTWADIDNLQIGIECDSPEVDNVPQILTIRPNAIGDVTQLTPAGDTPNWKCVDEETKDDMATVVRIPGTYLEPSSEYDLYNLTNYTTETGTISKIVVFAWVWLYRLSETKTVIKTNGSTHYAIRTPAADTRWYLISTEYALNPTTSFAWTWNDINDLQAGIFLTSPYSTPENSNVCTQVYVAVHYSNKISPEIRTTQCYAKVNYVPTDTECVLNKPENISVNHSMNIKMLNFWNGTREVYSLNRSGKSMVLTGSEYQSDTCDAECPCEHIACIKEMGKDGSTITVSGLRSLFNGEFKIRSFGWKHISEKPEYYEWILELEYDD